MHANFRQSDELMLRKKERFYLTFFDRILTAWLRVEHSKMLQGPFPLIAVALTQFLNTDFFFIQTFIFYKKQVTSYLLFKKKKVIISNHFHIHTEQVVLLCRLVLKSSTKKKTKKNRKNLVTNKISIAWTLSK